MRDKLPRRSFLAGGLFAAVTALCSSIARAVDYLPKFNPTATEVKGPYYPITAQKDRDFDLTQIKDKDGVAKGDAIVITGRVIDTEGVAVEDASVEIWQANAAGRYAHPHDPNTAPLDPNFQGWAIVQSGKDGGFRFVTVTPGEYRAGRNWVRPPHIHFKIMKRGYVELITQMYFPGHKLNEKDLLLKRKGAEEQKQMIAKKVAGKPPTYLYTIVLQKA